MALETDVEAVDKEVVGVTFKDNNLSKPGHYFYRYEIDLSKMSYRIDKGVSGYGGPNTLQSGSINSDVAKGKFSLEVTVIDKNICLYVDQQVLRCIQDSSLIDTGTVGLFVRSSGDATFSNISVWEL